MTQLFSTIKDQVLAKKKNTRRFFSSMADWTIKNLFFVLFVGAVVVYYIGNVNDAKRKVMKIQQLQAEVITLRESYFSLRSDLMYKSKRSEIEKKVKPFYLVEGRGRARVVEVEKGKY